MGPCQSTKKEHPVKAHRVGTMNNEDKVVMQCKMCRDNIKAYIKRLEKNQLLRREKAKEEVKKKDRDRAKIFLNQAKLYGEQVNVATGQLTMVEEQIMMLETAQHQKEAITVLEQGNKILKELNEAVNVEKWEKIADDMSELKNQQDEIANFLKNNNIDEDKYEEELNIELEKLMAQQSEEAPKREEKIPEKTEEVIQLPDAGKKDLKVETQPDAIKPEEENKQAVEMNN